MPKARWSIQVLVHEAMLPLDLFPSTYVRCYVTMYPYSHKQVGVAPPLLQDAMAILVLIRRLMMKFFITSFNQCIRIGRKADAGGAQVLLYP